MPSQALNRLAELGLELPVPSAPVASYVPVLVANGLAFVSGQVPIRDGKPIVTGSVPSQVSETDATECAKVCCLNALAALQAEIGDLDKVQRVIRVGCFVASDPGYGGQPKVANGASDLLQDIFGDAGKHARAAVGCSSLPLNVPVEIEFLFQIG